MSKTVIPPLNKIRAELCRRDFARFVREAWSTIEPGVELKWNWHMEAICNHVQALYERRLPKNNLCIGVPPRSSKTTIVSVCFPAWVWTKDPSYKFMASSGSFDVMSESSIKCRDLLKSDWYHDTFEPIWDFAQDQNQKTSYKTSRSGFRNGVTVGGAVTGRGAQCLLIDDPNQAVTIFSKAERENVLHWYRSAFANRLNDAQTGIRILIQQRLHEEDLTGFILANERDQWEFLTIPQEFDPDRKCTTSIWEDPRSEEGELLFPARFPAHILAQEKARLGSSGYSAQHQQLPTDAEGELFKRGFVRTYTQELLEKTKFNRIILSLDPASKEKEQNDPSGFLVIGETDTDFWVLDRQTRRMNITALKEQIKVTASKWKPHVVLIESNAHGAYLIQELKNTTKLPIEEVFKNRDKVFYAQSVIPTWEAGKILVPSDQPWTSDFLEQCYAFPKVKHDDDVDSLTQAINHLLFSQKKKFKSISLEGW